MPTRRTAPYILAAVALIAAIALALSRYQRAPLVDRNTVWMDTVKRGPMVRQVRGLGVLAADQQSRLKAELKFPESLVREVQPGQAASIDTRNGVIPGRVSRVGSDVQNGAVTVEVALEGELPPVARSGLDVDGTIDVERLENVVYIGRPVSGKAGSATELFRVQSDGKMADRIQVKLGRASVNTIQVVEGLQPGDRVILSDMSTWNTHRRIRLN